MKFYIFLLYLNIHLARLQFTTIRKKIFTITGRHNFIASNSCDYTHYLNLRECHKKVIAYNIFRQTVAKLFS